MAEYNVTTKDMGNLELCIDCLVDANREDNVIKYEKFAGVA